MSVAAYIVIGIQIILCVILIAVILFQSGNQRGLSGSIAGGAETFFGKNKGRTLDAKLKKWTGIIAVLFLASSIALSFLVKSDKPEAGADLPISVEQQQPTTADEVGAEVEAEAEAETEADVEAGAETPAE